MTVKAARILLGDDYKNLSDKEVESIVTMLYNLSKATVRSVIKHEYEKSN